MDNKLTAVEWLVEQYANENYSIEVYEQAKAMEKEQLKDAWINGDEGLSTYNKIKAEQYYNKTYGQ
jgi:hypothetical protein